MSVSFDEENLVSPSGLVPVMRLAQDAGLHELSDEWLSVPTDKGANAGLKVAALVAGMVAGADSIDDMAVLRHGGMKKIFTSCYAPSTLGSFLRSFTFGHVRQLDAVASRFLASLARPGSLPAPEKYGSTCPNPGSGKPSGRTSTPPPTHHHHQQRKTRQPSRHRRNQKCG